MNIFKMVCGASALLGLITSCGGEQASSVQASLQKYPTQVVSREDVVLESTYPVTIKGREDIEIRPRVDGFIESIYVDEGTRVKKGQVLFQINSPQSKQALISAQAAVQSARARVNIAKVNVERIRPLVEKDIISKVQLQTTESTYESELASLAQAEAGLMNAEASMSWTQVTSPVDGLIGSIPYRQGSLVDRTNILTTVANTSRVFAYFSLNEKELSSFLNNLEGSTQAEKLKNAPAVTLTLADGSVYAQKGKIETITGSINETTGTAGFRAEFPNEEGTLKSGTSGRISIPRTMPDAILVPQKATYAQQNKTVIYLVQADSVVQRVISVLPTPDSQRYVVTEGLSDNDRIVSDGIAILHHGKKIAVE